MDLEETSHIPERGQATLRVASGSLSPVNKVKDSASKPEASQAQGAAGAAEQDQVRPSDEQILSYENMIR
jgi:hypothetical protein